MPSPEHPYETKTLGRFILTQEGQHWSCFQPIIEATHSHAAKLCKYKFRGRVEILNATPVKPNKTLVTYNLSRKGGCNLNHLTVEPKFQMQSALMHRQKWSSRKAGPKCTTQILSGLYRMRLHKNKQSRLLRLKFVEQLHCRAYIE